MTMRLIHHMNVTLIEATIFGLVGFVFTFTAFALSILSFLIMFSEACYHVDRWLKYLIQKVSLKEDNPLLLMDECKQLLFEVLKRTNDAFSGLLFWLTSTYLIGMILVAYFALSFLFDSYKDGVPFIRIAVFYGSITIMLTLYFMNSISNNVTGKAIHFRIALKKIEEYFSFVTFDPIQNKYLKVHSIKL